jgi:hypothetical protein
LSSYALMPKHPNKYQIVHKRLANIYRASMKFVTPIICGRH